MSLTVTFAPGTANELVLDESNFISINPVWTHSGKADLRATLEERRDLDEYAQRKDRFNVSIDGNIVFTGYLKGTPHNERTGNTTLRADGIFMRLEETRPDYESIGGPVEYTSIRLDEAIEDYWSRTPFDNYTVTDQDPTVIDTDAQIQDADTTTEWQNITSLTSTDPLIIENGYLKRAQSGYFAEAEDITLDTSTSVITDAAYSGGEGIESPVGVDSDFEHTFSTEYDIPEGNIGIAFRFETDGGQHPAFDILLNGTNVSSTTGDAFANIGLRWREETSLGYGSDLTAGNNTVRFDVQNSGNGSLFTDAIFLYDTRFSYTFDNTVDANGYLSGPGLYPGPSTATLATQSTNFNIDSLNEVLTINDTSNGQAIALSNDGGATYTTNNNTADTTVNFSSAGRNAKVKLTLDGFGSRTTATPTERFNGQEVDVHDLDGTLSNLVVIDELQLSRDHFSNLQKLHSYGDFIFTIDHTSDSIANIPVYSFNRGDETRTSPSEWDNPENILPEVKADNYFNSIYLEGALDAQGDRPTAEVKDSDTISDDGREIQAILRDPSITTEDGAQFRANALLAAALSQNDLEGTIESPPNIVTPGFAYSVDFGEGEKTKTLESINLRYANGEYNTSNEFTIREGFSDDINKLKRNARDIGDKV